METLDQRHWLSWLVRVRFIIITFLLAIELIIQQVEQMQGQPASPVSMNRFMAAVVFWYLLDLIFHLLLQTNLDQRLQAYLQTVADAVMVTLVVYYTGGLDSYFFFLYPVTILVGSMVLPRGGGYVIAALCFVQSWIILEGPFHGWMRSYGAGYPDLSSLRLRIVSNLAAFLAVAYLAGRLAEILRKTGVELRDQATKLENLRALNQEIVESMRGGLITTDLNGRILLLNTPGGDILNTSFYATAGQPLETVVPGLTKEGRPDFLSRRELVWHGGLADEKFLGFSVAPLSRNGRTVGYVYNFQDLTKLKALERELQLQDRMAAIGRMAAAIAHEIRNPLASIAGSLKLFSGMADLAGDQQRLINIVLKESERLNRIITEFLLYAREKTFQFSAVNIVESLEETLTLLENHPRRDERLRIERHFPRQPVWVSLDADRMRQVFWNLGDNALKAMPEGGVLSVELQREGNHVQILFRDSGVGITPQQAEKIFEPFQSEFEGGTGLGLAIAYEIVQAHKGSIRVESGGKGSVFCIELPVEAPAPAPLATETVHG
jgi:two-component system sensor histidine kinase PilS (NtrC family)